MTEKKKRGRPSVYSAAVANEICDELRKGRTLTSICADENMPDASTVIKWTGKDDDFYQQYARAREAGYQLMSDELLDVADDARNDWMDREVRGGTIRVVDEECVKRSILRVDTRKWLLSKALPKIYGDKLDVNAKHEAGDSFKALWEAIGQGAVKP